MNDKSDIDGAPVEDSQSQLEYKDTATTRVVQDLYESRPRTVRLAAILLWSFTVVAIGAASFYLLNISNIYIEGLMFFIPLIPVAAVLLMLVYAIIRRRIIPLAMIGVVVLVFVMASTSNDYDFVSSISRTSLFVLAPPVIIAAIMILTDAYNLVKKYPSVVRSDGLRIGIFVAALIGAVVSLGFGLLILAMGLSLRACELSGSSKCM